MWVVVSSQRLSAERTELHVTFGKDALKVAIAYSNCVKIHEHFKTLRYNLI